MKKYENEEQEALFNWIDLHTNKYKGLEVTYAIPNGGSRHKLEAYNLKKQGVRPGVPDVCIPVSKGKYIGLYIEMKVGKNKPTKSQEDWIYNLKKYGHHVVVCYSWVEAVQSIVAYFNLDKERERERENECEREE